MSGSNGITYPAPRCGDCGELFAGTLTATGTSPLFDGALHAGARTAGWAQIAGRWKCSVCLAGITGPLYGPEREPAPALPAPDSDPLDQSLTVLAEIDARSPGWWDETNRRNSVTAHKCSLRFGDGLHGFEALFRRDPDLKSDEKAAEALRRYEADLAERAEAMHRASLERLAELRDRTSVDMAGAA